nr:ABC transporter permease [Candidatus Sigynarchaeota archaeon]
MLAVIGIVIGVLAVTALGILGNSVRLAASDQLYLFGNELVVFPYGGDTISEDHFEQIDKVADAIPVKSSVDKV